MRQSDAVMLDFTGRALRNSAGRSGPFKKTTSTTPRDAVENILDTLKGEGSLRRMFAAYGA
jgi:hypothetical protein